MSGRIGPYPRLRLILDGIAHSPVDPNLSPDDLVSEWNIYFNLPLYGDPFTSARVVGNEIELYGGGNITLDSLNGNGYWDFNFTSLLEIVDTWGCIKHINEVCFQNNTGITNASLPGVLSTSDGSFAGCTALTTVYLPNMAFVGESCFANAYNITSISLPRVTVVGNYGFDTCLALTNIYLPNCTIVGTTIFDNIVGNNITLTIPATLVTNASVVQLQANNTVTIITT